VLVVREVIAWDTRRGAVLALLNGDRVELRADVYDHGAAKAIHRNLVKVPRWSLRGYLGRAPSWLCDYVHGDLVVCKLQSESLWVVPTGDNSGLEYREDKGVAIPSWCPEPHCGTVAEEGDDESYDW
jgi:hypothetical protein